MVLLPKNLIDIFGQMIFQLSSPTVHRPIAAKWYKPGLVVGRKHPTGADAKMSEADSFISVFPWKCEPAASSAVYSCFPKNGIEFFNPLSKELCSKDCLRHILEVPPYWKCVDFQLEQLAIPLQKSLRDVRRLVHDKAAQ